MSAYSQRKFDKKWSLKTCFETRVKLAHLAKLLQDLDEKELSNTSRRLRRDLCALEARIEKIEVEE